MPSVKRSRSTTPTPRSTPYEIASAAVDLSPTPSPKKSKSSTSTPKSQKTSPAKADPKTPAKTGAKGPTISGGSEKKMGAWSGDELRTLYQLMCPKRTGVNWAEIADHIEGRDAKSCNNKWTRMQGKLEKAIQEMGE